MPSSLNDAISRLGVSDPQAVMVDDRSFTGEGDPLTVTSPIDGKQITQFSMATADQLNKAVGEADCAFRSWRVIPAPRRGELVRRFGNALREHKEDLAVVVSNEAGKIYQESLGEVQEMIDICEFAVGQSRQLYGKSIASERPSHRLTEQWHPLGPIGVISAFNFPVAVWAWNAALAFVCGDPVVWKPSEKTPLCALACQSILNRAAEGMDDVPEGLSSVVIGGADVGAALAVRPATSLDLRNRLNANGTFGRTGRRRKAGTDRCWSLAATTR